MVRLIQNIFEDGVVTEEVAFETVVFLPKGRGGVLGDRDNQGGLEGLRDGGEFSSKEEWGATRRTP